MVSRATTRDQRSILIDADFAVTYDRAIGHNVIFEYE